MRVSTDNPPVLRWGRELTTWPLIKLRMAAAQLNNLGCEVDIWNLEHRIIAKPHLSEDRRLVEVRVTEYPAPPVVHWSALLGNAIASIRSAADSFAWQLAHLDGNEPPDPRRVYFPTAEKPRNWKDQVQALGELHEVLLRRFDTLRELDGGSWMKWISAMAELNNIDKHRSALQVSPDFSSASTDDLEATFLPGSRETTFTPLLNLQQAKVGDVVANWRFSSPISEVKGTLYGTVSPGLEHGPVQTVSLTILQAVSYGIQYLRTGDSVSEGSGVETG